MEPCNWLQIPGNSALLKFLLPAYNPFPKAQTPLWHFWAILWMSNGWFGLQPRRPPRGLSLLYLVKEQLSPQGPKRKWTVKRKPRRLTSLWLATYQLHLGLAPFLSITLEHSFLLHLSLLVHFPGAVSILVKRACLSILTPYSFLSLLLPNSSIHGPHYY